MWKMYTVHYSEKLTKKLIMHNSIDIIDAFDLIVVCWTVAIIKIYLQKQKHSKTNSSFCYENV